MQESAAADQNAAIQQWRTDLAAAEQANQLNDDAGAALKESQAKALAAATASSAAAAKALRSAKELFGYLLPGETGAEQDEPEQPRQEQPAPAPGKRR